MNLVFMKFYFKTDKLTHESHELLSVEHSRVNWFTWGKVKEENRHVTQQKAHHVLCLWFPRTMPSLAGDWVSHVRHLSSPTVAMPTEDMATGHDGCVNRPCQLVVIHHGHCTYVNLIVCNHINKWRYKLTQTEVQMEQFCSANHV